MTVGAIGASETKSRSKRRRSHAAANDAVLHEVSFRLLAERGVDGLSFSEMAEAAGLTRAPIYARYDSPEDVAADLWTTTLEAHLDRLMEMNAQWYSSDDELVPEDLLAEFASPSSTSAALVEVLAVARRFPFLHDIVERSLLRRIDSYVAASPAPRAIAVTQLSVLLGTLFLAPVVGPTLSEGWKHALPVAKEMLNDRDAWNVETRSASPVELPLPSTSFGDEVLDDFVPAIMRVIARSGYENASANRIAREAGRTFNVVYERFDSKDALMERVVQAWVEDGINLAFTPFFGLTGEQFIHRSMTQGRSLVADLNRPFRNLRNEMTLAARHHRSIAENTAALYRQAALMGRRMFEERYSGVDDEVFVQVGLIGSLVRSNGFGLCLMASCTGALADVDWTPASTAHQRSLYRRVISKLDPRAD